MTGGGMSAPHAAAAIKTVLRRHGEAGAATGVIDSVVSFLYAIDWRSEYWIWLLFAFYGLLLWMVCVTRRQWQMQFGIICASLACVYNAERLNLIGNANWREFAAQNYFDRSGVFVSLFWSAPFIFISLAVLIFGLYDTATLAFALKRQQIRRQQQRTNKSQANAASAGTGAAKPAAAKKQA